MVADYQPAFLANLSVIYYLDGVCGYTTLTGMPQE